MSIRNALMAVAVIAAIGFGVCLFGGIGIDSTSKGRDKAIEETVSSVVARTDAAAADAATALEQVSTAGSSGKRGLACWDLDGNGTADAEEDVNGDGDVDVLDCRGQDGAVGPQGPRGKPGFGLKIRIGGRDGKPGKDCVGGGGECVFTSVCCTDDGGDKPTATATAEPTNPDPAKKPAKAKKNKQHRRPAPPATIEAGGSGSVVNYNYNSIVVEGVDPGSVDSGEPLNVGRIRNEGTLNLNVNSVRVQ